MNNPERTMTTVITRRSLLKILGVSAVIGMGLQNLGDQTAFAVGGLTGQYYDNQDLTNLKLTRTDATVNFDWGSGSPDPSIGSDSFSVRWTGQVKADYSQTYTFYTNANDGVRLWVNGRQLINRWSDGIIENSGTIALQAGQWYPITLEYYEGINTAKVSLSYASPSTPKQIIPSDHLQPSALPATATPTATNTPTPTATPVPLGQPIPGLRADGSTDDSAALAAALSQPNTRWLLPVGRVKYTSTPTIATGVKLYGQSQSQSVLVPYGDMTGLNLAPGAVNVALTDFGIDGTNVTGDSHKRAISAPSGNNGLRLTRLWVRKTQEGITVIGASDVIASALLVEEIGASVPPLGDEGTVRQQSNCYGVRFEGVNNGRVENSTFDAKTIGRHQFGHAIQFLASSLNCDAVNNRIVTWGHGTKAGGGGIHFAQNAGLLRSIDNVVTNCGDGGIFLDNCRNIAGVLVLRGSYQADGPVGPGCELADSAYVTFQTGTFRDSVGGIWAHADFADVHDILIDGCTITGNHDKAGIHVNPSGGAGAKTAYNVVIRNNTITGGVGFPGVWVQFCTTGIDIDGNTIRDNADKNLWIQGNTEFPNTGLKIRNNTIDWVAKSVAFPVAYVDKNLNNELTNNLIEGTVQFWGTAPTDTQPTLIQSGNH